ncbi:MAG: hypothetical protein GF334_11205 [Candidatus Altiarchaeales archaeon]|nr:hypothetical protein [Candidatus Altiarchaeales archaeon]
MHKYLIFGIHVGDRENNSGKVQSVLTEFGCNIKTRLGIHETDSCMPNAVILVQFKPDDVVADEFQRRLEGIPTVQVKKMVFD